MKVDFFGSLIKPVTFFISLSWLTSIGYGYSWDDNPSRYRLGSNDSGQKSSVEDLRRSEHSDSMPEFAICTGALRGPIVQNKPPSPGTSVSSRDSKARPPSDNSIIPTKTRDTQQDPGTFSKSELVRALFNGDFAGKLMQGTVGKAAFSPKMDPDKGVTDQKILGLERKGWDAGGAPVYNLKGFSFTSLSAVVKKQLSFIPGTGYPGHQSDAVVSNPTMQNGPSSHDVQVDFQFQAIKTEAGKINIVVNIVTAIDSIPVQIDVQRTLQDPTPKNVHAFIKANFEANVPRALASGAENNRITSLTGEHGSPWPTAHFIGLLKTHVANHPELKANQSPPLLVGLEFQISHADTHERFEDGVKKFIQGQTSKIPETGLEGTKEILTTVRGLVAAGNKIEVFGVDVSLPNLSRLVKDPEMAQVVQRKLDENPGSKLLLFVGGLHGEKVQTRFESFPAKMLPGSNDQFKSSRLSSLLHILNEKYHREGVFTVQSFDFKLPWDNFRVEALRKGVMREVRQDPDKNFPETFLVQTKGALGQANYLEKWQWGWMSGHEQNWQGVVHLIPQEASYKQPGKFSDVSDAIIINSRTSPTLPFPLPPIESDSSFYYDIEELTRLNSVTPR